MKEERLLTRAAVNDVVVGCREVLSIQSVALKLGSAKSLHSLQLTQIVLMALRVFLMKHQTHLQA